MVSHKRQLQLRDWLLTLLEVNSIQGLEWVDRDKQIFAISWRHGRKKGWASDIDSKLFKEWAVYKKRYQPGDDARNAKLWKSRFRCALNALPDIIELKTLSNTKGENAKKIYQFLQKTAYSRLHRRKKDNCGYSTCTNMELQCEDAEAPVANEVQCNIQQPFFLEQNMDTLYRPYMETFRNEDEELEWLFYETQQAMCTTPNMAWTFDEDDLEANKSIDYFLTPKYFSSMS